MVSTRIELKWCHFAHRLPNRFRFRTTIIQRFTNPSVPVSGISAIGLTNLIKSKTRWGLLLIFLNSNISVIGNQLSLNSCKWRRLPRGSEVAQIADIDVIDITYTYSGLSWLASCSTGAPLDFSWSVNHIQTREKIMPTTLLFDPSPQIFRPYWNPEVYKCQG